MHFDPYVAEVALGGVLNRTGERSCGAVVAQHQPRAVSQLVIIGVQRKRDTGFLSPAGSPSASSVTEGSRSCGGRVAVTDAGATGSTPSGSLAHAPATRLTTARMGMKHVGRESQCLRRCVEFPNGVTHTDRAGLHDLRVEPSQP